MKSLPIIHFLYRPKNANNLVEFPRENDQISDVKAYKIWATINYMRATETKIDCSVH